MHHLAVEIIVPFPVDDAGEDSPEMRKKSGMRKGLAKATTAPMKLPAPAASSTPKVECIMTTMTMQKPLA
jgi:hypothetical protein